MSHGPSTEGSHAEPNLVPLLDVVLQLIMFFMLTVNFVRTDQINESIVLPVAQTGVPLDKTVKEVLFLNLNRYGKLIVNNEKSFDISVERNFIVRKGKDGILYSPTIGIDMRPKPAKAPQRRDPLVMTQQNEQDFTYRPGIRDLIAPGGKDAPYQRYEVWTQDSAAKIKAYLDGWKNQAERRLGKNTKNDESNKILAVVRYDKGARWDDISQLYRICSESQFKKLQLRVNHEPKK